MLRLFKRGPSADWRAYNFWSGRLRSSPFRLEIVKEILKQRELFVPGPVHFETEPDGTLRLVLKKEEAVPLRLGTRNDYYLGEEFHLYTGGGRLLEDRSLGPFDWREQDLIFKIAEGDRKVRFEMKIYETSTPPRYHWEPGPGDGGYKILWQQLFETNLAKAFP
jgi:hypothetical protein